MVKKLEEHDKNILNMMGIFLTIFSVIGLGISGIFKIEDNHLPKWLMICGSLLITMNALFYLINYSEQKEVIEKIKLKDKVSKLIYKKYFVTSYIGILLIIMGGIIIKFIPDKNESISNIEKRIELVDSRIVWF